MYLLSTMYNWNENGWLREETKPLGPGQCGGSGFNIFSLISCCIEFVFVIKHHSQRFFLTSFSCSVLPLFEQSYIQKLYLCRPVSKSRIAIFSSSVGFSRHLQEHGRRREPHACCLTHIRLLILN